MTVERALRVIAGFFVIASAILARYHSIYWLFFTVFVGLNLFQSGFTNYCPNDDNTQKTWCQGRLKFQESEV